jgi:hypothetical protein
MFESVEGKILCGNSISLPEVDPDYLYDEQKVKLDALRQYYVQIIVEKMGKPDFKENFQHAFHQIQELFSLRKQKLLCYSMMEKVNEVYDFEFPTEIDFTDRETIFNFYDFVKFYEYDHEDFIIRIWKMLNPEPIRLDIESFVSKSENKIILEIEEQIEFYDFNGIIADFLRTNTKENMIFWFKEKSKALKPQIQISLLRKEQTNG